MKKHIIICAVLLLSMTACSGDAASPKQIILERNKNIVATTNLDAEEKMPTIKYYNIALSEELQQHVYDTCEKYDIPEHYELVLAIMQHESNFDASVISATDDYGLMQINICNHEWLRDTLGIVDFLDPYENTEAGVYLLSNLFAKYDDVSKVLMCYNMGEAGAQRQWDKGIESTTYSMSIMDIYNNYI